MHNLFLKFTIKYKKYISTFLYSLTILIILFLIFLLNEKIIKKNKKIKKNNIYLTQIFLLNKKYYLSRTSKKKIIIPIKYNQRSINLILKNISNKLNLSFQNMQEKKILILKSIYTQSNIFICIKKITIDKLNYFINSLENNKFKKIKISTIKIYKKYQNSTLLNAEIKVIFWDRK